MRTIVFALCLAVAAPAAAQDDDRPTGALDPDSYVALSADQRAQMSIGGFRHYLERVQEDDAELYGVLDRRLGELEERETIADVIFWTGTVLGALTVAVGAPLANEFLGLDPMVGFLVGGGSTFLLGVIIQAIIRPGHDDLMALIDLHDERLGRR